MDEEPTQGKIKTFLRNVVRVLRLTKKPKKDEFTFVAKVTGLGILLIGAIGYAIESLRWIFK
jgi:protein transport protein SEC61 subunit gamma-like protein